MKKNVVEIINSSVDQGEKRICELEDRTFEIIYSEENNNNKNKESLCDLWDTIKRNSLRIIGVPEEERQEKGESLFKEILPEKFPNLGRDLDIQAHETYRTPTNSKRSVPRHIVINLSKKKKKSKKIDNFKSRKRKEACILSIVFKSISKFLSRNLKSRESGMIL